MSPPRRTGLLRFARNDAIETRPRDASAPELCHAIPTNGPPDEGRRSAERRSVFGAASADAAARHTDRCCHLTALRARAPPGAPPRHLPRKSMPWLSPGRVSWDLRKSGITRHPLSQSSEAPRRPVVMRPTRCPGPPGSAVTSPARGNRTRPVSRLSPVTTLRGRDWLYVTKTGTIVKKIVTVTETDYAR